MSHGERGLWAGEAQPVWERGSWSGGILGGIVSAGCFLECWGFLAGPVVLFPGFLLQILLVDFTDFFFFFLQLPW